MAIEYSGEPRFRVADIVCPAIGGTLIGVEQGVDYPCDYVSLKFNTGYEIKLSADYINSSADDLKLVATITKWEPDF